MLLLTGPSGAGKTTILQAINFVLYGTGTKLITVGKTSCKVELEFQDLTITRTKRPNRLVVFNKENNEELEDTAGQSVIDIKFGSAFDVTAYVQQNASKSFIMMGPLDKLAFLEKFAFQDIDLTKLKARCQAIIKKRNEDLISVASHLETVTNLFNEKSKPEKVSFPLQKKSNKEKSIKNELTRLKNCKTRIKKTEKNLTALSKESNSLKVLQAKVSTRKEAIETNEDKLGQLVFECETTDYKGDSQLEEYEQILEHILNRRQLKLMVDKYDEYKRQLEEMKESVRKETKEELGRISSELWSEYKEDEIKETIKDYKEAIKDAEELSRLKKSLGKIESVNDDDLLQKKEELIKSKKDRETTRELLANLRLEQDVHKCPVCDSRLHFKDGFLEEVDCDQVEANEDLETIEERVNKLTRIINRLEYIIPEMESRKKRREEITEKIKAIETQYEDELPDAEDLESEIQELNEYRASQTSLEKKKKALQKSLDSERYPSSVQTFEKTISKQKESIRELRKKIKNSEKDLKDDSELDEEKLREIIITQRNNKERIQELEKRISTLEKELGSYKEQIKEDEEEHQELYGEIRDIVVVDALKDTERANLSSLNEDLEKHQDNVSKIEKYQKYTEELKEYNEWKEKVRKAQQEENEHRSKYSAATQLKEKILEAESIAILNIIDSINSHAQDYLDVFFPSDPIIVRLLPFKTTKKKTSKPQINVQIDYKGMEADLGMLSGGELSRVVLAYTLALAEIFNSPLILLDECTASLDQNLTGAVIDGIKSNFGDKMVLVIAHQVVSGIFDRELKL